MAKKIEQGLEQSDGTAIVDMNASWTSKWYKMEDFLDLGIHLVWDAVTPTGTLLLEYTWDVGGISDQSDVQGLEIKDTVTLDGSFSSQAFLDSRAAIAGFRLRFAHTGGTANITLASRVRSK